MALQVYGIPNCGTCKKALKWLDNNGIDYEFINTKEQPPNREQLTAWVEALTARPMRNTSGMSRSEEHTSELQSPCNLVCRLLLEKKKTDRKSRSLSQVSVSLPSILYSIKSMNHCNSIC